ncbi:glycerophosphoryl diester phosphodiesterase membrane domain-containing protein [Okeania sp.]|uniref:glycerophosphoryl diester phosphodiesterase membrane domain-containing protein n=1 Tax=Okeania sp. TaxID=3100323 RepID=UPI002B4AE8A4|nr:hypothetical protein [Okeania sp.]MEB3341826.1 hypothetical protein [Okeania sp.]
MEYIDISSINLLKKTLKTIIAIGLPLLIIGLPAFILAIIINFFSESSTIDDWLNGILILFVNPWLFAVRYFYIWQYLHGKNFTLIAAFTRGIKKCFPILISPLIIFAPIKFMPTELMSAQPFLVLVILSIFYISTRLSFYWHIVIIDGVSVVNGIRYSWELTKGYFWLIIRVSLILFIIGFLIIFPLTIIALISIKSEMVNVLLNILIQYVFMPIYWSIISVLIYGELKRRGNMNIDTNFY